MKTIKGFCLLFCLLMSASVMAQITNWRDLYKVKKKDTLYGIAQQYGLTVEDLTRYLFRLRNPHQKRIRKV